MITPADAAAWVRHPEYTGENRCLPCTVLNVVLAAAGALLVAELVGGLPGAMTFGASLLLIYLRGYLVPGTPQITAVYFPERVLRLFGTADHATDALGDADATTRTLLRAGILARDGTGGALRPAPDFQASWRQHIRESPSYDDEVADMLGAAEAIPTGETSFVVDGRKRVQWESETALVADLATTAELRARFDEWPTLSGEERLDLLAAVRAFLPCCPHCGGHPETDRQRIDPCCQPPHTVVSSACSGCGTLLLETPVRDAHSRWIDALPAEEDDAH